MADKPTDKAEREPSKLDERVSIPLDPEEALRALLKVDPEAQPAVQGKQKDSAKRR